MLTARIFDEAGIDFLLVGDSAGNNVFGYDTTLPVTVDDLIPLTRAVAGAVKRAFVVADMPFGSYENGPDEALHTAFRFMKETGAHAVKLEGGVRSHKQIRRIVSAPASRSWRTSASRRRASTASAATSSRAAASGVEQLLADAQRRRRTPARSPSCSRWFPRMPPRQVTERARHPHDQRRRRPAHRRPAARLDRLGRPHHRAHPEVREAVREPRAACSPTPRRRGARTSSRALPGRRALLRVATGSAGLRRAVDGD